MMAIRFGLVVILFGLLSAGLHRVVWPSLLHFRHAEVSVPSWVHALAHSVVIPFLSACLLCLVSSESFKRSWVPFAIGPLIGLIVGAYVEDSFFPPYIDEAVATLGAGTIAGLSSFLGWFVGKRAKFGIVEGGLS